MGFASPRQEAAILLLKASDHVRRRMTAVIEPYGVTLQQYNVLSILRGARQPLPVLEIAARMVEHTPGITRLLDRLQAKSLVIRVRCSEDRRIYHCSITEAGLTLLASMDAAVLAVDEAAIGPLTPDDVDQFIRFLRTVLT